MIGLKIDVNNGSKKVKVFVKEEMVGKKMGELEKNSNYRGKDDDKKEKKK